MWISVATNQNPGDYASRGLSTTKFLETKEWFNGPDFLSVEEVMKR